MPDDTPDALASGPTMPDSTSIQDCERIAAKYNLVDQFPKSVADLFRQHALEETPKSDDPAFVRARWWTVLSNKVAIDEAAAAATRAGFAVEVDNSCDDWPYEKAAAYLLNRLRELRSKVSRVCLISGGEVTVTVRNGGIGGRNQQFALACAEPIAGHEHHRPERRHRRHRRQQSRRRSRRRWQHRRSPRVTPSLRGPRRGIRRGKRSPPSMPILFSTRSETPSSPAPRETILRDLRILLAY